METAPIYTLSGGTKQKLALATALATGADTLILDELCQSGSWSLRKAFGLLEQLNRQGITLLIVDHRPNWWRGFLSRIVLMEQEGDLDQGSIPPQRLDEYREEFSRLGLFLDDQWLAGHSPAPVPQPPGLAAKAEADFVSWEKAIFEEFVLPAGKRQRYRPDRRQRSGQNHLAHRSGGRGTLERKSVGSGKGGIGFPESPVSVFDADCGKRGAGYLAGGGAQGEPEALKEKAAALLEEFGLLLGRKTHLMS